MPLTSDKLFSSISSLFTFHYQVKLETKQEPSFHSNCVSGIADAGSLFCSSDSLHSNQVVIANSAELSCVGGMNHKATSTTLKLYERRSSLNSSNVSELRSSRSSFSDLSIFAKNSHLLTDLNSDSPKANDSEIDSSSTMGDIKNNFYEVSVKMASHAWRGMRDASSWRRNISQDKNVTLVKLKLRQAQLRRSRSLEGLNGQVITC
ncbi:unnamed protein product [Protopolystoma xenopodis]|uniref:Uncharacterized protein n=1 Tax=Protopolystoma xenopodis TaxID=117903 RepID=A0A3S5B4S3_9PLAT|nr:unnamed protein product [Protopolystoma xenopodis]